jgi:hypothetical protein
MQDFQGQRGLPDTKEKSPFKKPKNVKEKEKVIVAASESGSNEDVIEEVSKGKTPIKYGNGGMKKH